MEIHLPIEASLVNPDDPTEVTLIADVSSVGITRPTATGRVVKWTPELLKAKARTLVGKPVNVFLEEGSPTSHSRNVIGTILEAVFDEVTQKLRIVASLWRHYFPETVARLKELGPTGFQVSVEFGMSSFEEEGGITEPKDGVFMGVGIVDQGADLGNKVWVLASALQSDLEASSKLENENPVVNEEETTEILPMSFEWAGDQIANFLSSRGEEATVIGTFPDRFVYTTNSNGNDSAYTVHMSLNGDTLTFGDPVSFEEGSNNSSTIWIVPSQEPEVKNMEELAEVQASLARVQAEADDWKSKYETLHASVETAEKEREAEKRANGRLEEIEKIAPYEDASLKAEHFELFKTEDEKIFETVKKLILATVEPKGGIAPEGEVPATDENADPVLAQAVADLPQWREELKARYGLPKE